MKVNRKTYNIYFITLFIMYSLAFYLNNELVNVLTNNIQLFIICILPFSLFIMYGRFLDTAFPLPYLILLIIPGINTIVSLLLFIIPTNGYYKLKYHLRIYNNKIKEKINNFKNNLNDMKKEKEKIKMEKINKEKEEWLAQQEAIT